MEDAAFPILCSCFVQTILRKKTRNVPYSGIMGYKLGNLWIKVQPTLDRKYVDKEYKRIEKFIASENFYEE